jgi:hypothetical protein
MIAYKIDKKNKLVIAKMAGEVSFKELLGWHFELAAREEYEPAYSGIADMREANMQVTIENLQELVEINREQHLVSGRWVCLVDTPTETALAMLYKNEKSDSHPMELFSSTQSASAYLQLDVEEALATLEGETG